MHLLMISLDTSVLTHNIGDSYERHREYARRLGQVSMVVYTRQRLAEHHAGELHIYPVYCPHPVFFPLLAFWKAWQVHRQQPVEAVTTQEPFATGLVGVLLKLVAGIPLNVQNHSSFFHNPHWISERPFRNRILHLLGKFVIRFGDVHRVVNSGEKQRYIQMGIPAERIDVIQAPMAVQKFAMPATEEAKKQLRGQLGLQVVPTVLWVGRVVAFKRLDVLLDVFEKVVQAIPEAQLLWVCDLTKAPQYVDRVKNSPLLRESVVLAGGIKHDDLPTYYALADVYVITSIYEGMARVIVEAMAAGKPVVSPLLDGSLDVLVDGQTGLLTGFSVDEIAAGVITLLQNPDRARQMGQQAQQAAQAQFDRDNLIDRLMTCFRRTVQKS